MKSQQSNKVNNRADLPITEESSSMQNVVRSHTHVTTDKQKEHCGVHKDVEAQPNKHGLQFTDENQQTPHPTEHALLFVFPIIYSQLQLV